jgi:hypothetical protein
MRKFNEELRSALGVPTYYNEALGSTCRVTAYDRVKGRLGDVPEKSVKTFLTSELKKLSNAAKTGDGTS